VVEVLVALEINQIVDRTTASTGIPDIMTVTTSTTPSGILLRRWSLTIGRWYHLVK
jgi:hypothetical protein